MFPDSDIPYVLFIRNSTMAVSELYNSEKTLRNNGFTVLNVDPYGCTIEFINAVGDHIKVILMTHEQAEKYSESHQFKILADMDIGFIDKTCRIYGTKKTYNLSDATFYAVKEDGSYEKVGQPVDISVSRDKPMNMERKAMIKLDEERLLRKLVEDVSFGKGDSK